MAGVKTIVSGARLTRVFLLAGLATCGCGQDTATPTAAAADHVALSDDGVKLLQRFVDECVAITPGTEPFPAQFRLGSDQEGEDALQPADVQMTTPFKICQYETTQELFELVMGRNPSRWPGKRNSVETITFAESEEFCQRLTALLRAAKLIAASDKVRLPTEVEWEYCCRAGTTTRFSFGDEATIESDRGDAASVLSEYAWHTGNAGGNDPPVGFLRPNPWMLYDMHGYLWEYVLPDPVYSVPAPPRPDSGVTSPAVDDAESGQPTEPLPDQDLSNVKGISGKSGTSIEDEPRVIIRGGSWRDVHQALRSSSRRTTRASRTSPAIGFRCVIVSEPPAEDAADAAAAPASPASPAATK